MKATASTKIEDRKRENVTLEVKECSRTIVQKRSSEENFAQKQLYNNCLKFRSKAIKNYFHSVDIC